MRPNSKEEPEVLEDKGSENSSLRYYCMYCGEQGLKTLEEGEVCNLCGLAQHEPFRARWDESD